MSKPLEDGTNGIVRGLVTKNIDDSLELEASRRNIFSWRNCRLPSPTRINLEEPQVTQPNQD
jgi:hypothetical protein